MALKVFQRGNFIITDNGQENSIPIDNFDYQFIDTTLKLKDVIEKNEVSDSIANVQDESGSAIGDESAIKAYFATFIKQGSGAPAVGGSTAANQAILNDQTAAKQIGYVLDITSQGSPPPYEDLVVLEQTIDGAAKSYAIANLAAAKTKDLAQVFNDLQTDVFYAALDANSLYFVPVSDAEVDVSNISFEDGNEGLLSFDSPFVETVDAPTGALHQLVTLMQKQLQILSRIDQGTITLEAPVSLSYTGNAVKNITIDADLDGNTIPVGRFADITIFAIDQDAYFAYDSQTVFPSNKYPKVKKDRPVYLKNVNLDTFRVVGSSGGAEYALSINLIKQ